DLFDGRLGRPEADELLEITDAIHLLTRHRAVDGDPVIGDVLEYAVVGGRRPARVVFRLEPVDRDDDRQAADTAPVAWNFAHRARHELRMDAARAQERQQRVELAVAHERFTADDRNMQRAMFVD